MSAISPDGALESLQKEVEQWVREIFSEFTPLPVRDGKIVRDGVHGFQHLQAHEVALVDTPILQRLRHIHQTALAYLIYPTMSHSRFDHSLGMAFVADAMMRSLKNKHPKDVSERQIQTVRLASLIHDIGHTIFSHMGEGILESRFVGVFDQIKRAEVRGKKRFFEEANSGEILSYLIATSPFMKSFFEDQFANYRSKGCELESDDVDVAAGLVVGRIEDDNRHYMSDVVNGPLDADKLDYLRRDCHFSGIRADIDVPRIVYGLDWISRPGFPRYLTTDSSVVPQLEQVLLCKLLLFTSIYHHHKVRTLECMMKAVFDSLFESKPQHIGLGLERITDFLRIHEFQFLTWGLDEPSITEQVRAILERRLLKRALVLNAHTVDRASRNKLTGLRSAIPNESALLEARSSIFHRLSTGNQTHIRELWLDLPTAPDTDEEAQQCWVTFGPDADPQSLADTLPADDWVATYVANKLNYFVFYNPDEEKRRQVADRAKEYLQDEHNIGITPRARGLARI